MMIKVTSRITRWGWLLFLPRFGCSCSHLPDRNNTLIVFFAISLLFIFSVQDAHALELSSDNQLATAGYYQLSWSGNAKVFQLQESPVSDFDSYKVIYEGKDLARVVSGKPDGDYFYRIKTTTSNNSSQTSNVVKVTVSHHPLQTAILFFLAGAIVFIAILILIIKGNKLASS